MFEGVAEAAPFGGNTLEGDNLDALKLLQESYLGKVKLIYIDPPYNTGNKDWVYNDHYVGANDRWRHSQWLEFLYRRLSLARDLLTPDGVILVSINDENRARLELLMDEVMPGRRLGSITWRTRQGSNADQQCFLSVDHEHVLVYGNPGFAFNGFAKSYEMYGNPDKDPRGDWRTSDLTLGYSYKERPNLYYPLLDAKTGIAYPPNPDRVWVYASESRLKEGQTVQAKTMEEFIRLGQILFPTEQRTETWPTLDALLAAIDAGDVPKSGKTPLLRRDLPDLEFWVGRPVGFGRPQFKRYKADLRNQTQPLSSWVVPTFEAGDYETEGSFVAEKVLVDQCGQAVQFHQRVLQRRGGEQQLFAALQRALERLPGAVAGAVRIAQLVRFVDDHHIPGHGTQLGFQFGGELVGHDHDRLADQPLQCGEHVASGLLAQ